MNSPSSSKQVRSGEIDNFVSAAIQDRPDQIQVEIDDLVELERRRHRELLPVYGNVHESRTIMREGLLKRRADLLRIVNMQAKNSRTLAQSSRSRD